MYATGTIAAVAAAALMHGVVNAPADACALLTQAEVNTVLGAKLEAGTHPFGGPTVCGWTEAGGATITNKRVLLTITSPERYAVAKTPIQKIAKIPVSGLGDDAFYATVSGLGTTLEVKKGNNAFTINVKGEGWSVDQKLAMEKALAADVIARL
jgi:hypothetical protein